MWILIRLYIKVIQPLGIGGSRETPAYYFFISVKTMTTRAVSQSRLPILIFPVFHHTNAQNNRTYSIAYYFLH